MSTTSGAPTTIPQENGGAGANQAATTNNQEEIDIDLKDPQVQDAAKKIQNVFRGKRFGAKATAPAEDAKQ
ncbi:Protein CBG01055 [Caenorhabditis briggsae]|uniref:Uncharacterized protein n=2 Tax=Caenorhabditis briggsae TaxID=6238 RepID=A0AAE9E7S8_CAEBR|nr:Protein CBG01055 [Caenorhabditis briggsae]ULU03545.1 hypothetical protein L3Y34_016795 [Caenorhabditis briggsae]UMM15550.1 hypothetical protein L5515_012952 [Caenorhabditis briggsae]CAP22208.1 Protein CBG01055 [Caenorhabditis briggsae]